MRKICLLTTLKILQLPGDEVPRTPYRGSAPGPRWGTSVPRPPVVLPPHPKPPSGAYGFRFQLTNAGHKITTHKQRFGHVNDTNRNSYLNIVCLVTPA